MAVPEAPVHQHNALPLGQHDVRAPGQIVAVEPKAQSLPVQRAAHDELRRGIDASNAGHHPAARLRRDDVGHIRVTLR